MRKCKTNKSQFEKRMLFTFSWCAPWIPKGTLSVAYYYYWASSAAGSYGDWARASRRTGRIMLLQSRCRLIAALNWIPVATPHGRVCISWVCESRSRQRRDHLRPIAQKVALNREYSIHECNLSAMEEVVCAVKKNDDGKSCYSN